MKEQIYARLAGPLVFVGFGSVAQAVLPLIRRHIAVAPELITIFTADERGHDVAGACGVADFRVQALTPDNYERLLAPALQHGGLLLNLSYDVSSIALIEFCHRLARSIDDGPIASSLAAAYPRGNRLLMPPE